MTFTELPESHDATGTAILFLSGLLSFGSPLLAQADNSAATTADSFAQAFTAGDVGLEFRSRYELVDDDAFARDANALTLRSRLNFKTLPWQGWQMFVEADNVTDLGVDNFNGGGGTTPGREQFPVIADAGDTRLNQLWLQYQASPVCVCAWDASASSSTTTASSATLAGVRTSRPTTPPGWSGRAGAICAWNTITCLT